MYKASVYLLLVFISTTPEKPATKIERDGIEFQWEFNGEFLDCIVTAPCQGWVAIAFNDSPSLVGSNLIMGAAEKGHFKISDRYIVKAGDHRSVISLGVYEAITHRNVVEFENLTQMSFSIKTLSQDQFHKTLTQGKEITVWLAYSTNDNFSHHSAKRISTKIKL